MGKLYKMTKDVGGMSLSWRIKNGVSCPARMLLLIPAFKEQMSSGRLGTSTLCPAQTSKTAPRNVLPRARLRCSMLTMSCRTFSVPFPIAELPTMTLLSCRHTRAEACV